MTPAKLMILLIGMLGAQCAYTQKPASPKAKYLTWVKPIDAPEPIGKYLIQLKDSSVVLLTESLADKIEFPIGNIERFEVHNRRGTSQGILIGALTGFATGAIIGGLSGDSFPLSSGQKALILGPIFAVPGGLLGGLIGQGRIKIPIGGKNGNYLAHKKDLEQYLFSN